MTTTDTTAYLATAGTRTVHLTFDWQITRPACNKGMTITGTLAPVTEGLEGTLAALTAAEIAPARLCKNCFPIRTRKAYADARTQAPAPAAPAAEPTAKRVQAYPHEITENDRIVTPTGVYAIKRIARGDSPDSYTWFEFNEYGLGLQAAPHATLTIEPAAEPVAPTTKPTRANYRDHGKPTTAVFYGGTTKPTATGTLVTITQYGMGLTITDATTGVALHHTGVTGKFWAAPAPAAQASADVDTHDDYTPGDYGREIVDAPAPADNPADHWRRPAVAAAVPIPATADEAIAQVQRAKTVRRQLDAALETANDDATPQSLPAIGPADPAAETSLDAKLTSADVAEPREIERSRGAVRNPEKFLDLTPAEFNALRGRGPVTGPTHGVVVHPVSRRAIVVGTFDDQAHAAAWWAPEFNKMRSDGVLLILVSMAHAKPTCAAAAAGVYCSPACFRSRGADCENPLPPVATQPEQQHAQADTPTVPVDTALGAPALVTVGAGAGRAHFCVGGCYGYHIAQEQSAICFGLPVYHPDAGILDGVSRWATRDLAQAAAIEYTRRMDARHDVETAASNARQIARYSRQSGTLSIGPADLPGDSLEWINCGLPHERDTALALQGWRRIGPWEPINGFDARWEAMVEPRTVTADDITVPIGCGDRVTAVRHRTGATVYGAVTQVVQLGPTETLYQLDGGGELTVHPLRDEALVLHDTDTPAGRTPTVLVLATVDTESAWWQLRSYLVDGSQANTFDLGEWDVADAQRWAADQLGRTVHRWIHHRSPKRQWWTPVLD